MLGEETRIEGMTKRKEKITSEIERRSKERGKKDR